MPVMGSSVPVKPPFPNSLAAGGGHMTSGGSWASPPDFLFCSRKIKRCLSVNTSLLAAVAAIHIPDRFRGHEWSLRHETAGCGELAKALEMW